MEDDDELFSAKRPPNLRNDQESPPQTILIRRRIHALQYLSLKVIARRKDWASLPLPNKIKVSLRSGYQGCQDGDPNSGPILLFH